MVKLRQPFQGVWNIVRFNWHFYLFSVGLSLLILLLANYFWETFRFYLYIVCVLIICTILVSLLVSYFVYDLSGLYTLNWMDESKTEQKSKIVNINAGFDEISPLLKDKFTHSELLVFDFYDPAKHTEIAIKRARKIYPSFPNTQPIITTSLPLTSNFADKILVVFSAHEIRNEDERIDFFKELNRVVKPTGQVIITEHLRDMANFLAYNIGFFHFYSKSSWRRTFQAAKLKLHKEIKFTPFISVFILGKNGNSL